MAAHALRSMAQGGMYDILGGGFARYSVDSIWLIPHFEKMLYDNAQLALAYLHAYQLTSEQVFREVCEATLDFTLREMTHPSGGFYSSLDADSDGEEGKFYLWNPSEIRSALIDRQEADLFIAAYGVNGSGNFEGRNILRRTLIADQLASRFHLEADTIPARLTGLRKRLLEVRSSRLRPGADDKVIVSWNALMLTAFAEAGRSTRQARVYPGCNKERQFCIGEYAPRRQDDAILARGCSEIRCLPGGLCRAGARAAHAVSNRPQPPLVPVSPRATRAGFDALC